MIRGILTCSALISAIFFPWPFTAFLALVSSPIEPFLPFASGIFLDTLYYTPSTGIPPFFAITGAIVTLIAFSVRSRVRTGIIKR